MKTTLNRLLFTLFLLPAIIFAQTTLTGTVTEQLSSQPLPGVNVLIKGTTQGTATDFDGNYQITANNGDIIVFGIPLIAGDRIKSVKYSAFGGDAGNKQSQFRRSLLSTGVATTLENEPSQAVAGFYTRTWNIADITLTTDTLITYNWAGNNSGDEFYGVAITYDHPA